MVENGATFLVIFDRNEDLLLGSFNGPVDLSRENEKYVRYFKGRWLVGDNGDGINYITGCNHGSLENKTICILGMLLTYNEQSGFLTLTKEDLEVSKESFPKLTDNIIGTRIAHVEWPSDHIFQLETVVGYLPCNVKWSNVLRFDPSNDEGKCLHFTATSQGTIFVIFAAVPNNKNTWYYVQISPYGVGIFKVSFFATVLHNIKRNVKEYSNTERFLFKIKLNLNNSLSPLVYYRSWKDPLRRIKRACKICMCACMLKGTMSAGGHAH